MSERPLTLSEHTLRRFLRWMLALEALCAPWLGAALLPYAVRRHLFRELRNMERVARRLAWLMALDLDLPPARRTAPRTRTTTARPEPAPTTARTPRAATLGLTEPLPQWPLPDARPDTAPLASAHPGAHVPAGHFAHRLGALQAFAADPGRLARRLALWHHRRLTGRRSGRPFPVPMRDPPRASDLPQLTDVLGYLQLHCRGDPDAA